MVLAAGETTSDRLEFVAGPDLPIDAPASEPIRRDPDYIGPYRILERIGEGGMGVVYKAEQRHPIHRTVAIKIVKLGMDTHDVVARFEAERQALAMMNHTNVAKVFEAGATEEGRPYFVMEYVRGEPITTYCDQHKLSVARRLELFIQVCNAVQHAHQKAIIHRDIKPSNLLLTVEAQGAVVKVIDFGVAKALGHRLTDHTLFTEHGKLIGTVEYMSPEQAEISGVDMDTRTDIYSLGVVLYELVTGALPFDSQTLRTAKFDDLRRIIREQEPPRPSQRLTALEQAGAAAAAQRDTDCTSLRRTLSSELEWIPLKAMSKDRSDRYRSAAELADDVNNYLQGRPLIAGPQTTLYWLGKFVRKHRRGAVLASAVAVTVLGLIVALAVETGRAIRASNESSALTVKYQDEVQRARRAERAANERTADKLVAIGDAQLKAGQIADARQTYIQSLDIAIGLGLPSPPLFSRLFAISDRDIPIMGAFGKDQGVGGFTGGHVHSLALCPDGYRAVTANADSTLTLWDLRTGLPLHVFTGHTRGVTYVTILHDGKRMLSSSFDHAVRMWDLTSYAELEPFTNHPDEVYTVAVDPEDHLALSGDLKGNLDLWDLASHEILQNLHGHSTMVAVVAFSPDGKTAISGGRDSRVMLWDIVHRRLIRTYTGHLGQVNGVAFSPDGRTAVSGSFDGTVRLWDLSRDDVGRIIGRHEKEVWRVAFSPDGHTVASGSKDTTVSLWDVSTGKRIGQLAGHTGEALGLAFSADGHMLVASGADSSIRVWDLTDQNVLAGSSELAGDATSAAIADQGLIAVGTAGGRIILFDAASRQKLGVLPGHSGAVKRLCLSSDGQRLLSCSDDGSLRLWDLEHTREIHRMLGHAGAVTGIWLLSGERAISCGADRTLRVWDLSIGKQIRTIGQHAAGLTCLAVSADGRFVACGATDGTAGVWEVATGSRIWRYAARAGLRAIAFSPDGHSIALGAEDGTIQIGDSLTAGISGTLAAGTSISDLAFLSDSVTLWSSGQDGALKLWSRGQLLVNYPAHHAPVMAMAISPDLTHAVSAGSDGARTWEFSRPVAEREFERQIRDARASLGQSANDPKSLATFGQWLAFRGKNDWAADLLEQGRAGGAKVSALSLGRCYWRLGHQAEALREMERARKEKEASDFYIGLCVKALLQASAASTQPAAQ
ncbi:MAG: pknB 19 [Phycisphaerales bacterium]|nr:pknB 19 [Phycisphaerales bacterium]